MTDIKQQKTDVVIITDLGSVDPDDIFALLLGINICSDSNNPHNIIGIITSHNYPTKKAKLTRLILSEMGRSDIKVYVGNGIEYDEKFNSDDRKKFFSENELFPHFFGFPASVYNRDISQSGLLAEQNSGNTVEITNKESMWFPNFMKAYYEYYENIDDIQVE